MVAIHDVVFGQEMVDGVDLLPPSSGIYCIMNRRNGRKYIGQASNMRQRCLQHRSELRLGNCSNVLMRRDAQKYGASAFFFFAIDVSGIADTNRASVLNKIEVWFSVQLASHDEVDGYNLEVGHQRTMASRFRERERKLLRRNSSKYALLAGVDLYDPIHPELLGSWVPGG